MYATICTLTCADRALFFGGSLSRSSDEAEGIGNSVRHREPNRRLGTHGERRHRCRSSSSVDTNDSGSSIESQGDDERTRRRHRRRNRDVGAGLGSSSELIFTRSEETRIIRSLQRKLLSNDGARLSRIERRLLQADPARSGVVSMSTFRAALSKEAKSGNGANIGRDETIWLMENLRGRNGKNVAILKIRGLLDTEEPGVKRRSGVKISEEMEPHRSCRTRRGSTQSNNRSRGTRRRAGGPDTDDGARERLGGGGRTTSESDTSGQGGASLRRRASPAAPARWAIRHGTVGQWLHDVAAPMVSVHPAALQSWNTLGTLYDHRYKQVS